MTFIKAQLVDTEGGENLSFMFNPNNLSFSQKANMSEVKGARTAKGLPKVSFAYPDPCVLTIKDINFDTYETGQSVLTYINKFKKAMDFATTGAEANKCPPLYLFTWGSQQYPQGGQEYVRCFVTNLSYNLTQFLPNGTPVRAKMTLTLGEVDTSVLPNPQIFADLMGSRASAAGYTAPALVQSDRPEDLMQSAQFATKVLQNPLLLKQLSDRVYELMEKDLQYQRERSQSYGGLL